jgi:peptide/nickel transport system substrate-binding protein
MMHERLMRYPIEGEEPKYQPSLAERIEMSPDGLTWDFYLRQGIQFHEGWGELTVEDVLYSYQLLSGPDSTMGTSTKFRLAADGGIVESYETVNPYHFRMHLIQPNMEMQLNQASRESQIVSKRYYDTVGREYAITHPIGTGPWKFVESRPAEFVRMEAVEDHWRVTPEFKYLTIRGIPELSARIAMLQTGAADFAEIPVDKVAEVKAAGLHTKTRSGAGCASVLLGGMVLPTREHYDPTLPWTIHQDEPTALADNEAGWGILQPGGSDWNRRALKVRMAMTYAINVDAIIDNMFFGEADKGPIGAAGNWAPFGSPLNRPHWKPMPYDPELAKQLLEEAGYPDGFEFTFLVMSSELQPRAEEIGEAVIRDWEAIGLTVNRRVVEYAVQRPWFAERDSAWMAKLNHYGPFPEPWSGGLMYTSPTFNAAYNDGYESLELDELLIKCSTTLDFDERMEAIRELGDYYWPQYIIPPVVITSRVFALSTKVEDVPVGVQPLAYYWGNFEYATRAD